MSALVEFHPGEVDAALALVHRAEKDLKARLQARGYENATVSGCDGRFFIMPHRYRDHQNSSFFAATYSTAVERIASLPVGSWSPSLIEQTLGVTEVSDGMVA